MFRVGQKVVCVDAETWDGGHFDAEQPLVVGRVYTVASVGRTHFGDHGISLVENRRRIFPFFGARRFRPVVERKTDISIFHEIARKATKRKPVNAE